MRCLIDADILLYEIGSCGEYDDEETGKHIIRSFDFVAELLDQRIKEIEGECWADQPSTLYLTGSEYVMGMVNRVIQRDGVLPIEYKPNFRFDVATVKPYKGNRKDVVKPYHTRNLIAYMMAMYDVDVANGYEADDAIIINTLLDPDNTIVCTRDKDLRQAGRHHFGWACGKQPQFGPKEIDPFGSLEYNATKKKLTGEGIKFFYSQLLTGDSVDNIPGLPGCGPAKAFKLLDELETEQELCKAVEAAYESKYEGEGLDFMYEQAHLLYMIQEIDDEGRPVMWKWPTYE